LPTLRDIQHSFRDSIFSGQNDDFADVIIGDDISAADRLCIYRNTARSVLTEGLRLSYPVIDRLVGRDFFDMAATGFLQAHPPASGYLNAYGENFPAFLEAMQETAGLAYLGDVGRYEWALGLASDAPDVATIDLLTLAAVDPDLHDTITFVPHPSVSLLRLGYPADTIADAVMAGDDDVMTRIDLASGPIFLVVHRDAEGVQSERLERKTYAFLRALFDGQPLAALMGQDDINAAQCLSDQFTNARLAGFVADPAARTPGSVS
jgi:hypothetical protein